VKDLRVVVFDQQFVEGAALGPWRLMQATLQQIITALKYPVGARHPPDTRLYTVEGAPRQSVSLPPLHDLFWSRDLAGQRELNESEAAEALASGNAIQLFIYNGDSDCVRHYLLLPLDEPVSWLPENSIR